MHAELTPSVHVQLGHARLDLGPRPGVAGSRGAHAALHQVDFIRIFAAPHVGDGCNDRRRVGIAGAVVDAEAGVGGVDFLERGELARPASRRLAVVPGDDDALLDLSLRDGLGQAVIVQEFGLAVVA